MIFTLSDNRRLPNDTFYHANTFNPFYRRNPGHCAGGSRRPSAVKTQRNFRNHTLMDSRTFGLQLSAALCCHHYHHRQPDCILSAPFFKAHLWPHGDRSQPEQVPDFPCKCHHLRHCDLYGSGKNRNPFHLHYRALRLRHSGNRPFFAGKSGKLRRRHPDSCHAALWHSWLYCIRRRGRKGS